MKSPAFVQVLLVLLATVVSTAAHAGALKVRRNTEPIRSSRLLEKNGTDVPPASPVPPESDVPIPAASENNVTSPVPVASLPVPSETDVPSPVPPQKDVPSPEPSPEKGVPSPAPTQSAVSSVSGATTGQPTDCSKGPKSESTSESGSTPPDDTTEKADGKEGTRRAMMKCDDEAGASADGAATSGTDANAVRSDNSTSSIAGRSSALNASSSAVSHHSKAAKVLAFCSVVLGLVSL